MKDILSLLHVDSKEDIYTFCLEAFLTESKAYRKKAASAWGFDDENYSVLRISIATNSSDSRTNITPDLILYNEKHLAVIESKMFSSEGEDQTRDYQKAEKEIKGALRNQNNTLDCDGASVDYYFFTLAGIKAESSDFIEKRWAEYYSETLDGIEFENEYLNAISKSIRERAQAYLSFKSNYKDMLYTDLTENENCWIGPFALFSAGMLNKEWGCDPARYHVYNGVVIGRGHSDFRTDISNKESMWLQGEKEDDSIYLFSRIVWNTDSVDIFLNYEYWKNNGTDYVPFSHLTEEHKIISLENREKVCEYLRKTGLPQNIKIPAEKKNMLHMLKTSIDTSGRMLGEIIQDVKAVLPVYDEYIRQICEILKASGKSPEGYYRFQDSN